MLLYLVLVLLPSLVCCENYVPWIDLVPSVPHTIPDTDSVYSYAELELHNARRLWNFFKVLYKREFKTITEELKRFFIFVGNLVKIRDHNSNPNVTYKMGVNKFSDWEPHELKILRGFKASADMRQDVALYVSYTARPIPETIDWRRLGAVTAVKDQGSCGSCWAFSATGSVEGQHFKKSKELVSLSEQQLVDCSSSYGNDGCEGGLMNNAFKYLKEKNGSESEKVYPYVSGKTGEPNKFCRFSRKGVVAHVSGFVKIKEGDEDMLKNAIATIGPVSVAINADVPAFMHYASGVFSDPKCTGDMDDLDHGVLVVGYGEENGIPYWLVKNSWGLHWGDSGYIKIGRNVKNMCGIATAASYPVV